MREMKDSGVEWIGEIPVDWTILPNKRVMTKVKNICEKYAGEDILSLTMNGVIVRDLENPSGKMPATFDGYQYVESDNLLMCLFDIDVTPRCIGIIKNNGLTSPAYSQFQLKSNALNRYFYYYYLYLDFTKELLHVAKNLRHSLTESQLGELYVPLPSMKEQIRIADYLDDKCSKIDAIIEKQQAVIEKLKAYKLSAITEAVTKGLNLDAEMKDSGIEWVGEIPEHWTVIKTRHIVSDIGDIDHYMPESVDKGIPYLMTGNLQNLLSATDFESCKQVSYEDYLQLSKKLKVQKGDLIFARYATIGTVCLVDIDVDCLISYSCVVVKPNRAIVETEYLMYYYKSSTFIEEIRQYSNANTQANVGKESMYKAKVCLPPIDEQKAIVSWLNKKCASIDSIIQRKESILDKLTEYKKSLIYEVVTGKKEV